MENAFGFTDKEWIFFKMHVISSGQWETIRMDRNQAIGYSKKFCDFISTYDSDVVQVASDTFTLCQERLLANSNLSREMLLRMPSFDDEGRDNLVYLVKTWQGDQSIGIEKCFEQIFGYPWEPVDRERYLAMEPVVLDLRQAAYAKYGTVIEANQVIENYGADRLSHKSMDELLGLVGIRNSRRGLNKQEIHLLMMTTLPDSDWKSLGIDEASRIQILSIFADEAINSGNSSEFIDNTFYFAQWALMAHRKDDFDYIQMEPPFSDSAVTTMHNLVQAFAIGGKAAIKVALDRESEQTNARRVIKILGGDWRSPTQPIQFSPTSVERRVRAERWFVSYLFGYTKEDWFKEGHMTIPSGSEGAVSVWNVRVKDGEKLQIHFSTSGTQYK